MTDSIETKRKEAYNFIVRKVKQMNWNPPVDSDDKLAGALDISVAELISLREGRKNPTQRLIVRVRAFLRQAVSEDDIQLHLVDPFQ